MLMLTWRLYYGGAVITSITVAYYFSTTVSLVIIAGKTVHESVLNSSFFCPHTHTQTNHPTPASLPVPFQRKGVVSSLTVLLLLWL